MDDFLFLITILIGIPICFLIFNWFEVIKDPRQFPNKKRPIPSNLDEKRLLANIQILQILVEYAANNPSQRFGQILRNTGVVLDVGVRDSSQEEWETPDYYWARGIHEEPMITLMRMEKNARGEYEETKIVGKVKK